MKVTLLNYDVLGLEPESDLERDMIERWQELQMRMSGKVEDGKIQVWPVQPGSGG